MFYFSYLKIKIFIPLVMNTVRKEQLTLYLCYFLMYASVYSVHDFTFDIIKKAFSNNLSTTFKVYLLYIAKVLSGFILNDVVDKKGNHRYMMVVLLFLFGLINLKMLYLTKMQDSSLKTMLAIFNFTMNN